jgi:hypothetical protein
MMKLISFHRHAEPRAPNDTDDDVISNASASVNVQTMNWALPIEVYPTNPANLPGKPIIVKGEF